MALRVPERDSVASVGRSPTADGWDSLPATTYDLAATPTDAVDTSKYVMQALDREDVGAVETVTVAGVHDGDRLALRLSWPDPDRDVAVDDGTEFVDKAAVAFPLAAGASVMTMGSDRAPINAWYWRGDRCVPYDVFAAGYGAVERREPAESGLAARDAYRDGRWHVVFTRRLTATGDYVDFTADPRAIAVAVWEGSNAERGPVKSYSGEFETLELEGLA